MTDHRDVDNEARHDWLDDREPEPVSFSEGDWGDERPNLNEDFIPAPGFIPPYDVTDEDLPF